MQHQLVYFTHIVDGQVYGGWYRRLSPTELEVLAVGLMERAVCTGHDELAVARSVLERFVRSRARGGPTSPPAGQDQAPEND